MRVTAVPPRDPGQRNSVVPIKMTRGRADAIAATLASRADVPFVDIASTGEEIRAFVVAGDSARSRLLSDMAGRFAGAVTDVTARPYCGSTPKPTSGACPAEQAGERRWVSPFVPWPGA